VNVSTCEALDPARVVEAQPPPKVLGQGRDDYLVEPLRIPRNCSTAVNGSALPTTPSASIPASRRRSVAVRRCLSAACSPSVGFGGFPTGGRNERHGDAALSLKLGERGEQFLVIRGSIGDHQHPSNPPA